MNTKSIISVLVFIITTLLLYGCTADDSMMHMPNTDYLHTELSAPRHDVKEDSHNIAIGVGKYESVNSLTDSNDIKNSLIEQTKNSEIQKTVNSNYMYLPVAYGRFSSDYKEISSIRNNVEHGGVDLSRNFGEPITTPFNGKVVRLYIDKINGGTCGNGVAIQGEFNNKEYITLMCHMKNKPLVELNDKVEIGETIGYVGSTGRSTGPHLHLEIRDKNWKHLDPKPFFQEFIFHSRTGVMIYRIEH